MNINLKISNWIKDGANMGTTELCSILENQLGLNRYQIAGAIGAGVRYGFLTVADRKYSETEKKIRTVYVR